MLDFDDGEGPTAREEWPTKVALTYAKLYAAPSVKARLQSEEDQ